MKTHRSVVVLMNNSGDQLSGGKSSNSSGNEDDVVDDKSAINDKITSATSSKQSSITTTTKAGPTASTAKATKTSGDGDGDSNDSDGGNKSGKRKKKKKKKTNNRMQYRSSDGSGSGSNTGGGLFPVKLHDLLTYAENHGLDKSVISWTDDGRAFIVHDQDKLVETLLPLFFGQTKYRSFHRQLNMWSFERVSASSIAAAAAAAKAKAKAGAGQQQLHMVNVSSAEHHSRKQIIFQHPFFLRGQKAVCQHMNREIFKTHPLAFGGTTSNSYSSASGSQRPPSPSSSSGSKRKYPIERKVHPASNDATAPLTKTDSPPTKKDKKMSPSKRCPHKRTTTAAGPKRTSSTTTTMASTTDNNNNNNSGLAMLPLTMRTFDQGLGGGGGDMSNLAGQPFFFLDMDLQQQQQLQQQQLLSTSRSSDGQQQQLPYRRPMVAAAAIDAQAQHDSIQSAAAASLVAQQHQANSSVDTTASVMASNEAESRSAGSIPFTANFNVVGGTSVGDVHLSSSGGGIHNASMPMGSTSFNQADVEPNPIFESQDPTRNAAVAANNQGQQDGGSSQFQAFGMPLLQAAASIANMNAFVNSPHQSMRLDHHHPHHHQLMLCTTTSSANASGAPLTIGHSTLGGDGDFVNNAMLTASASQAGPQAFISFNSNVNINNAVQSLNHTMSSLSAQQLQALNTLGGNPIAAPASDSSSTAATSTSAINSGQMDSDSGYFSHHGWHQSHKG